jgi:DNA-binding LacI/PurR family transcriptional regulator
MPAASRTIRLVDIAREVGVSRPVVAAALFDSGGNTRVSPALAARIRATAARLGYRPNAVARQLKTGRSRLIGVVIGADNPQVNQTRLLQLEAEAFRRGYRLLIAYLHDMRESAALMADFVARGVEGVFWLHLPFCLEQPPKAAIFKQLPRVIFNEERWCPHGGVIRIDYAGGIHQAVHHLATQGHRRIGMMLAGRGGWPGDPILARLRGYQTALCELGLPGGRSHVWFGDSPDPAASAIDAALTELLDRRRVTAIIASNDQWAAETIKALRRRGLRIPENVALVGFDNDDLARRLDPELTTVDHNHDLFVQRALELFERLAVTPAAAADEILIPARLVVRQST